MNTRTKLIVLALVLTAGIALLTFFTRQQTALLTVTASDPQAVITVSSFKDGKTIKNTGNTTTRFSQKVALGDYVVAAQSQTSSVKRTVTVKAGSETKVELTFSTPLPLERVAGIPAANFTDDGQNLQFINVGNNALTRINSQNQITTVTNFSFRNLRWADPSYGAGLVSNSKFYLIQDLVPAVLEVPFTVTGSSSLALAPNRDLYVSDGSVVYRLDTGKFTKIYQSSHPVTLLAASNDSVLAVEGGTPKTGQKADEGDILRLTRTGQAKRVLGESYDSAWSPDGSKVITNGDEGSAVLSKDLRLIVKLPQSNVNSPVWLDNDSLAFGIGSDVWRFDTSTGLSQKIASAPNLTITNLYPARDGSYIYVGTQNLKDGRNQSIQRVGLKNQKITAVSTILGFILPNTVGQCSLSYVNYTAPTVSVQGPKNQQAVCTASAQKYLQTYHVDTKAIGLSFSAL